MTITKKIQNKIESVQHYLGWLINRSEAVKMYSSVKSVFDNKIQAVLEEGMYHDSSEFDGIKFVVNDWSDYDDDTGWDATRWNVSVKNDTANYINAVIITKCDFGPDFHTVQEHWLVVIVKGGKSYQYDFNY